jgi:hypothetical protein
MRVPPFEHYPEILRGIAIFTIGIVVGCCLYLAIHHHHFNLIYIQLHKATEENTKLHQDIESLHKFRNKQSYVSIIHVHYLSNSEILFTEDIQVEIERVVKNELKPLIGQKVVYVKEAPWLCEKLVSQKTYWVHGRRLMIEIKSIALVNHELSVWISAKEKIDFAPQSR